MGEDFCAKPGELPLDASFRFCGSVVLDGGGELRREEGGARSGNDGSVINFVIGLQSELYGYIEPSRTDLTIA